MSVMLRCRKQCEESCDNVTGTESNTVCRKLRYLIPTDDERSISFKRFYFCLLKIFLLIFSNALLYVFLYPFDLEMARRVLLGICNSCFVWPLIFHLSVLTAKI